MDDKMFIRATLADIVNNLNGRGLKAAKPTA